MRISDWSSDVCSSDLKAGRAEEQDMVQRIAPAARRLAEHAPIVARRPLADELVQPLGAKRGRTGERSVGKVGVCPCCSGCSSYHPNKKYSTMNLTNFLLCLSPDVYKHLCNHHC